MDRRFFLLGSASAALAGGAAAQERWPYEAIDEAVASALRRLEVVQGVSVAVYGRHGTYSRGFGVCDIDSGERVDADTAFYIASSTKPLTALALATLAARGEFDLDAFISDYAPAVAFPPAIHAGEVRFRHLLSHTSGINNDPISWRLAYSGQHDPDTLWRLLGACEVNVEAPLGQFEYANAGYNIATVLTDRVLGVRWQDLLRREVFAPLSMTRTSAIMSEAANWSRARPHDTGLPEGPRRLALEKTDQTMQSAGGVVMSANDALRWLELLVEDGVVGGRQIVPAAVIRAASVPIATTRGQYEGYGANYGLGWFIGRHREDLLVNHSGRFPGARSHISYKPALGMGVAVSVNDSRVGDPLVDAVAYYAYDLAAGRRDAASVFDRAITRALRNRDQLRRRVASDRARRAERPWTLTRPLAAYEGRYVSELYGEIDIMVAADALAARMGTLFSRAEPFTLPDSIRLELSPGTGVPLTFEGSGAQPAALSYQRMQFRRV